MVISGEDRRPVVAGSAAHGYFRSMRASKAALLVYCAAVFLLAWWPWNLILLLGAARGGRLQRPHQIAD